MTLIDECFVISHKECIIILVTDVKRLNKYYYYLFICFLFFIFIYLLYFIFCSEAENFLAHIRS